jgi:predicted esterase
MNKNITSNLPHKTVLSGSMAILALVSAGFSATTTSNSAHATRGTAVPTEDTAPKPNITLFKYDASVPLDIKEIGVSEQGGAKIRDVTFAANIGGDPVEAYIVTPKGSGPFAGILYVHWLGEPATTNRTQFLDEAVSLASQGTVSILVEAMWAKPGWYSSRKPDQDYDHSIKQVIVLRRAMDLLLAQKDIDPQRVAYVGHDFGAMYGTLMAVADQRAKTYVFLAGAPRFSDWAFFGPQPKDKAAYLKQNAVLDPILYAPEIKNASVYFQFGTSDPYVSSKQADEYSKAVNNRNYRQQVTIYPVGHDMDIPQAHQDRVAWLQRELELTAK